MTTPSTGAGRSLARRDAEREHHDLEHAIAKLDDCVELDDWDREFVDDLCRRVIERGADVKLTGKQWQQFERMKEKYLA